MNKSVEYTVFPSREDYLNNVKIKLLLEEFIFKYQNNYNIFLKKSIKSFMKKNGIGVYIEESRWISPKKGSSKVYLNVYKDKKIAKDYWIRLREETKFSPKFLYSKKILPGDTWTYSRILVNCIETDKKLVKRNLKLMP